MNKIRSQNRALLLESKLLRSQMNPHFVFNTLVAIQGFFLKQDGKEASRYLARFSKLMRLILENSREEFISFEKEMATMEKYLEMQQIRFNDKIEFQIELDNRIDPESYAIPPMMAQPFVENAIEHGLLKKEGKGNIWLRYNLAGSMVHIEIEDNGIGIKASNKKKEKAYKASHYSLATKISWERLENIYKFNKKNKLSLEITDLAEESEGQTGTRVSFYVPWVKV